MSDSSCAVIVLAAGSSSRMGAPKQLLDYQGQALVRHAAEVALDAGCGPVIVVLGSRADEIRPALDGLAVETIVNQRWREGMGTSIQAGLAALGPRAEAAILTLGDQPLVTPEFLRKLRENHAASEHAIVAAWYSGTVGVPALFARAAFPQLLALGPNQGCKGVILKNQARATFVDCPEAALDIDTPDDYQRIARVGCSAPG